MKRAIRDFVANDFTRNVQVEIESDGHVIPIDLLADSVMSKQIVEMRKRYPVQAKMFAALEAARKEVQQISTPILELMRKLSHSFWTLLILSVPGACAVPYILACAQKASLEIFGGGARNRWGDSIGFLC